MNNIFNYANKELTQDAIIAWLLIDEKEQVKFINDLIGTDLDGKPKRSTRLSKISHVFIQGKRVLGDSSESSCNSKIDILCIAEDNKQKHYVIIEDKTSTFIHDNQIDKYVQSVKKYSTNKNNKKMFIDVVLFKTGDYYFWERDELEKIQSKNPTVKYHAYLLDNFVKFLKKSLLKNASWGKDYLEYISNQRKQINVDWRTKLENKNILENLMKNTNDLCIHQAKGPGKREYEIVYRGIHKNGFKYGEDVTNNKIEDLIIIVPVIRVCCNKLHCFINMHVYCDKNQFDGYGNKFKNNSDWIKQKKLAKEKTEKIVNKNKEFKLSREFADNTSTVQLCVLEPDVDFKTYDPETMKKTFNKLVNVSNEILKNI